jgi:membrane protease YdiL (CAAX protease family)
VNRRAILRTVLLSLAVLVVTLAAFVVGSMLAAVLGAGAAPADLGGYDYLRDNLPMLLVALAAVYVVSSFGEEAIYRGFLVTRVAELGGETRSAWGGAVVVSAVVFGLVHFDWGVVGVVQTTLMGLALAAGYLVVRRNLWALVLAHAYLDTLLLVQLYATPAGSPSP